MTTYDENDNGGDLSPDEAEIAEVEAAIPRKPRGRPRTTGVAAAPTQQADPMREKESWPLDVVQLWPLMIQWLAKYNHSPADVAISVKRLSSQIHPGPPVDMPYPIDGASVAGDESTPAGEALANYITDIFHVTARGPARYKVKFYFKQGSGAGQIIKEGELSLGSPEEVFAVRRALDERNAATRGISGGTRFGQSANVPHMPYAGVGGFPSGGYYSGIGGDPEVAGLRRELAHLMGRLSEAERRATLGGNVELPATSSTGVGAPVLTEDDRIAKTVAATLKALGIGAVPIPPATPAVALPPPATGLGSVIKEAEQQMNAMDQLLSFFNRWETMKTKARAALSEGDIEEEETPSSQAIIPANEQPDAFPVKRVPVATFRGEAIHWTDPPTGDEGSWVEWALKMATLNPTIASEILGKAATVLNQGALGQLLGGLAAQGGPAAQAAANFTGTGAPSQPAVNSLNGSEPKWPTPS